MLCIFLWPLSPLNFSLLDLWTGLDIINPMLALLTIQRTIATSIVLKLKSGCEETIISLVLVSSVQRIHTLSLELVLSPSCKTQ